MQNTLQKIAVTYLFDPFCGWCYGASPAVQRLGQDSTIALQLAPTGMFAGNGGRPMDANFADFAWSNDTRIEKLTGQRFTDAYRQNVLNKPGSRFDSSAVTLALTAVSLSDADRELATLKALQEARYVQALDTSAATVVVQLLRDLGLSRAADQLAAPDADLVAANSTRIQQAQALMQTLGVQGVPILVVTDAQGRRVLRGDALYGSFDALLGQIAAAA